MIRIHQATKPNAILFFRLSLIISGLLLLPTSCVRSIAVVPAAPTFTPAGPAPPNQAPKVALEGILFNLPKTVVQLDLIVERTTKLQGEFCEFNDLFWPGTVGKETVKCDPSQPLTKSQIAVTTSTITTKGIPDPDLRFLLPLAVETAIDSTDSMDLSEVGIVSGADSSRTDRRGEFALGLLSSVAGIAGKLLVGGGSEVSDELCKKPANDEMEFKCNFLRVDDEDIKNLLLENFSILKLDARTRYVDIYKKRASDEKYAKLLRARRSYVTLNQLAAGQTKLFIGDANGLSGIPEIIKSNKEEVTKLIGQAFVGFEKKITWSPGFELIPNKKQLAAWNADASETILFTKRSSCISSASSILNKNNIIAELQCKADNTEAASEVKLKLELDGQDQMAKIAGDYYALPTQPSYPFIIPARVKASLVDGDAQKTPTPPPATLLLAQWGSVHAIPVGKSAKGKNLKVTYYEATGALKSIKFGSESAFNKGLADSLSGSANAVLDGKLKADAAEAADAKKAGDELLNLSRRRQILEEMDKIQILCAKLGISCSN